MRLAWTVVAAAMVASCSHLPSGAPTVREFSSAKVGTSSPQYQIIDLTPQIVHILATYSYPGLAGRLGPTSYRPSLALLPGDIVTVTVFDVGSQSLLGSAQGGNDLAAANSPLAGHTTVIPSQVVELDGAIKIPYAGSIRIAGLTPTQASREIEDALRGQAHAPQAVVSVVASPLDSVVVGGDVARPGVIPLTVRAERILDVLAAAGGPKYEPYDSDLQLVRRGLAVKIGLQDVVDNVADNIAVAPGDSLFVSRDPRTFSVLGAAMKVSQYDFGMERVTLAEAVARAGGPNDALANVQNLYLLRYEPKALMDRLVAGSAQPPSANSAIEFEPVAYHLDLRHGGGYFLAQTTQLRDKDVIVITNADADHLQKTIALVRGLTGIYYDIKRTTGR